MTSLPLTSLSPVQRDDTVSALCENGGRAAITYVGDHLQPRPFSFTHWLAIDADVATQNGALRAQMRSYIDALCNAGRYTTQDLSNVFALPDCPYGAVPAALPFLPPPMVWKRRLVGWLRN
jgi:hypothetical protein